MKIVHKQSWFYKSDRIIRWTVVSICYSTLVTEFDSVTSRADESRFPRLVTRWVLAGLPRPVGCHVTVLFSRQTKHATEQRLLIKQHHLTLMKGLSCGINDCKCPGKDELRLISEQRLTYLRLLALNRGSYCLCIKYVSWKTINLVIFHKNVILYYGHLWLWTENTLKYIFLFCSTARKP